MRDTLCSECRNELVCKHIIEVNKDGLVERLYGCDKCGAAWVTYEFDGEETEPRRFFFG